MSIETLGDALPREINRCRELVKMYEEIGNPGIFAKTMIQADIDKAERAMAEGDLPAMIAVYQSLKEWKD